MMVLFRGLVMDLGSYRKRGRVQGFWRVMKVRNFKEGPNAPKSHTHLKNTKIKEIC